MEGRFLGGPVGGEGGVVGWGVGEGEREVEGLEERALGWVSGCAGMDGGMVWCRGWIGGALTQERDVLTIAVEMVVDQCISKAKNWDLAV